MELTKYIDEIRLGGNTISTCIYFLTCIAYFKKSPNLQRVCGLSKPKLAYQKLTKDIG